MRVDALRLDNFLAHESTEIDFTDKPMSVITGPVGSGKSAIVEAITWCIWGKSRAHGRQTDPLIREGAEQGGVTVTVFHEGQQFRIVRNRQFGGTSSLTFTALDDTSGGDSPLTRHTIAETQEAIIEELGLDWDAAQASVVAQQSGAGSLMATDPAKRKELLLRLLVGSEWEVWYEQAKDRWRAAGKTRRPHEARVESLRHTDWEVVAAEKEHDAMAVRSQCEDSRRRVGELDEDIERLTGDIATATAAQQEAILLKEQADENHRRFREQGTIAVDLLARVADAGIVFDEVMHKKPTKAAPTADEIAHSKAAMLAAMSATTKFGQTVAELRAFVAHVHDVVTCPNCLTEFRPGVKSPTDYGHAVVELKEATTAFEDSKHIVKTTQDYERDIRDLQERWRLWNHAAEKATNDEDNLKANEAEARARVKEIKADGEKLDARLQQLTPAITDIDALSLRVSDMKHGRGLEGQRLDAYVRVASLHEAAHTDALQKQRELAAARLGVERAEEAEDIWVTLAEAFHRDGIPTLLLESVLPDIEQFGNEVLGRMPGNMYLYLRTQKANKDGEAIERLDAVVTIDGTERGYEMLSGGQQFRVDLALRLALAKVLSDKDIDTLIIDEGLDRWQDPEGREAILEALMTVAEDFERVIVVSHHPDVVERFSNVIEVSMTDGISHVA